MKALNLLVLAACVTLVACKKEERAQSVRIDAFGRMCAIEITSVDGVYRDTIIGVIQGDDTLPGTGRWNYMVNSGDIISVVACHLRDTISDGPIHLEASAQCHTVKDQADAGSDCAHIEVVYCD